MNYIIITEAMHFQRILIVFHPNSLLIQRLVHKHLIEVHSFIWLLLIKFISTVFNDFLRSCQRFTIIIVCHISRNTYFSARRYNIRSLQRIIFGNRTGIQHSTAFQCQCSVIVGTTLTAFIAQLWLDCFTFTVYKVIYFVLLGTRIT